MAASHASSTLPASAVSVVSVDSVVSSVPASWANAAPTGASVIAAVTATAVKVLRMGRVLGRRRLPGHIGLVHHALKPASRRGTESSAKRTPVGSRVR
jgi:hypothetical protein